MRNKVEQTIIHGPGHLSLYTQYVQALICLIYCRPKATSILSREHNVHL